MIVPPASPAQKHDQKESCSTRSDFAIPLSATSTSISGNPRAKKGDALRSRT